MKESKKPLFIEALLFLFILPLLVALAAKRPPLLPILFLGSLYAFLRCRKRVLWGKVFSRPQKKWWIWPFIRGAGIAVFSLILCLLLQPEDLFKFPKNYPAIWVLVLFLYPLLSVFPQEIIYRFYFFEVIASPIKNKWVSISLASFLFSWVHIIYYNAFALLGSIFAGFIFNWIYWEYKDEPGLMWRLLLEHSLYGLIIFTLGLGSFFFLAN